MAASGMGGGHGGSGARVWFRDRALTIVLLGIFALTLALAAAFGWFEFASEQAVHGRSAELFGGDGYVWTLLEGVSQNWQSEFLAVFCTVALSARLIHRGSAMSRDGHDELLARAQRVRERVDALGGRTMEG